MTPRPTNRRPCPPATAVLPQSRNGYAQALSPGPSARSRRLQKRLAKPSTADCSRSDQPAAPHAGQRHLGNSHHLLLLLL
jgi:hypothetical protein